MPQLRLQSAEELHHQAKAGIAEGKNSYLKMKQQQGKADATSLHLFSEGCRILKEAYALQFYTSH